jgi:D-threonate/D-erythronate kinase
MANDISGSDGHSPIPAARGGEELGLRNRKQSESVSKRAGCDLERLTKRSGKIAVIADDYTGAGDAGIHFARFGRTIDLLLHCDALSGQLHQCGDIALTSETRFLPKEEAARVVLDTIRQCRSAGFDRIFKKIDSTMRGNPGSEIEAALEGSGAAAALICTAMPKTGRTCVDGTIYLGGVPLHATDMAGDPFHPVSTSRVANLLGQQTDLPIGHLTLREIESDKATARDAICAMRDRGVRLIVADAVDDRHLSALAQQLATGDLLPVGAGGFAEAFAATVASEGHEGGKVPEPAIHGPIVAVMGSMAEISRRQTDHAVRSGLYRTIEIRPDAQPAEIRQTCIARLGEPGRNEPNVLLRAAKAERPEKMSAEDGERVAKRLGFATATLCALLPCRTIVSTGGSTSMAVAEALGIESVRLVDEILPGIVVGACGEAGSTIEWFISKAGGFGEENLLTEIDARCTRT